MSKPFVDWLVKDTEGYTVEQKQAFLRTIKFEPERALQIISDNILGWATNFAWLSREAEPYDPIHDTPEAILKAYQDRYEEELAALT